jgi:DNA modification methylase
MNCIDQVITEKYAAYHGDCVDVLKGLPDHSIGYSIFSPPFASLYTYSNSPRDMGNVRNDAEFFEQFEFLIVELLRVMKPGRNVSFHCMDMPASKERDGHIGLKDFPGDLLRAFERHGFIFHAKATIWKDPVTAMTRTKALGLLHKSIRERSEMTRMGIPDYLITVRAPGVSEDHVTHTAEEFPVEVWQKVASPVWMDINPSDTLQYMSAREHDDERHICPLQLGVIRRGVMLWTNPGDIVLSPFMGIGSEGYVALEMGRKFIGAELKTSYFHQAAGNLAAAVSKTLDLFSAVETQTA